MFILRGLMHRGTTFIIILVLLVFFARPWAAASVLPYTQEPKTLQIVSGKSIILRSSNPIKRISVGIPLVVDFVLISPHEVYITGNITGTTNMILWQHKKVAAIYDIEVVYDISRLKEKLHEVLPNETDIRVIATRDSITLSGTVSSTTNLSQALALAESYAGYIIKKVETSTTQGKGTTKKKGKYNESESEKKIEWVREARKVSNLLQVAGVQQVMLEVRVAEMSRNLTKRLGINFHYVQSGEFGIGLLGGLTQVVPPINSDLLSGPVGINVSPAVNALFRFNKHKASSTWTGFVDALKEDGLVKILAEPTLIALSGQSASFLAGGEFPVPLVLAETAEVVFKPYGVQLSFTPTVLSETKISIKVQPEVSELDYSVAVQFGGYVVPGVSTRKAATVVELDDGQSFAIAGLLKETVQEVISKFPLLGDIPILGVLFRSEAFLKNETELVIIVTPHLVKPLGLAKQTLPTDFYIEPDDMDFYILGRMEGTEKEQPANPKGEMDGEFGYAMPITDN
jgi:pilus assembly protein CpaC